MSQTSGWPKKSIHLCSASRSTDCQLARAISSTDGLQTVVRELLPSFERKKIISPGEIYWRERKEKGHIRDE